jgi:hypothetical protein
LLFAALSRPCRALSRSRVKRLIIYNLISLILEFQAATSFVGPARFRCLIWSVRRSSAPEMSQAAQYTAAHYPSSHHAHHENRPSGTLPASGFVPSPPVAHPPERQLLSQQYNANPSAGLEISKSDSKLSALHSSTGSCPSLHIDPAQLVTKKPAPVASYPFPPCVEKYSLSNGTAISGGKTHEDSGGQSSGTHTPCSIQYDQKRASMDAGIKAGTTEHQAPNPLWLLVSKIDLAEALSFLLENTPNSHV